MTININRAFHLEEMENPHYWGIPPMEELRRGDILFRGGHIWVVIMRGVFYHVVQWRPPNPPSRLKLSRLRVFQRRELLEQWEWEKDQSHSPAGTVMRTGNVLVRDSLPIDNKHG